MHILKFVCIRFNKIIKMNWEEYLKQIIQREINELNVNIQNVQKNLNIKNKFKRRVNFLTDTTKSLTKYFNYPHNNNNILFQKFVKQFQIQLREAIKIVESVSQSRIPITENFDMIELTLRRYLQQFKRIFPKKEIKVREASEMIREEEAREFWREKIGPKKMYVKWKFFCEELRRWDPSLPPFDPQLSVYK
eukprot:TRINITY_DN16265_c0_g1_i1.p1 TRINITY_DN16265_c0_g1~~TRINITY_DN16265_c0_g1_i1.p1  ORF type:complete len:221 (+),score=51.60 TRINITY_DN16265_c0_g1_i1:90-665(+)